MGGCAKGVGDQLDRSIDEVTDKHSRGNDFGVLILFLVQVPCASDSEEIACISRPVQDQNDNVDNLKWNTKLIGELQVSF